MYPKPNRDPQLADTLYELVLRVEPGSEELDAELKRLEDSHGTAVYSELIFLLCHLHLEGEEALRCWKQVLAHREYMQERLSSPSGL